MERQAIAAIETQHIDGEAVAVYTLADGAWLIPDGDLAKLGGVPVAELAAQLGDLLAADIELGDGATFRGRDLAALALTSTMPQDVWPAALWRLRSRIRAWCIAEAAKAPTWPAGMAQA